MLEAWILFNTSSRHIYNYLLYFLFLLLRPSAQVQDNNNDEYDEYNEWKGNGEELLFQLQIFRLVSSLLRLRFFLYGAFQLSWHNLKPAHRTRTQRRVILIKAHTSIHVLYRKYFKVKYPKTIRKPVYNFKRCNFRPKLVPVEEADWLLVELLCK